MTDETLKGFLAIISFLLTVIFVNIVSKGKATETFLIIVLVGVLVAHANNLNSIKL